MANEEKKDFNAMLHDSKDMPKFQIYSTCCNKRFGFSLRYCRRPFLDIILRSQVIWVHFVPFVIVTDFFKKVNILSFVNRS